jgi:hypothetical protein
MGVARGEQHTNKIVREFLDSYSDASHLFFAMHVLSEMENADIKIDHQIVSLARRLSEKPWQVNHEDI